MPKTINILIVEKEPEEIEKLKLIINSEFSGIKETQDNNLEISIQSATGISGAISELESLYNKEKKLHDMIVLDYIHYDKYAVRLDSHDFAMILKKERKYKRLQRILEENKQIIYIIGNSFVFCGGRELSENAFKGRIYAALNPLMKDYAKRFEEAVRGAFTRIIE